MPYFTVIIIGGEELKGGAEMTSMKGEEAGKRVRAISGEIERAGAGRWGRASSEIERRRVG